MIDRRTFLRWSGQACAMAIWGGPFAEAAKSTLGQASSRASWLAGTISDKGDDDPYLLPGANFTQPAKISLWHPSLEMPVQISVPFFGHIVIQHPHRPNLLAIFEKRGRRGAVIDARRGQVLQLLTVPESRRFFGHAVFSSDGNSLFATAMNDEERVSLINVYDGHSFRQTGEIIANGYHAHDVQLYASNPKFLVLAHQGRHSTAAIKARPGTDYRGHVGILDPRTGEITAKYFAPEDTESRGQFSHLSQTRDGWIVACDRNQDSAVEQDASSYAVSIDPRGRVWPLPVPDSERKYFHGELLSLVLLEELAFVTSPAQNSVFVWNFKTRVFQRRIEMAIPRGLAVRGDKNEIFVNQRAGASLSTFAARHDGVHPGGRFIRGNVFNSSHLVSIEKPT